MRLRVLAVSVAGVLLAGIAPAGAKEPVAAQAPSYLMAGDIDLVAILPPAPKVGDARAEADRAIFRATRTLEATPRWTQAVADIGETEAEMLRGFSCAAGIEMTPQMIPVTTRLLTTAARDASAANRGVKNRYERRRPFHYDAGNICEQRAHVEDSYDYPSGHTTRGWVWAQILAELLPGQATPILARGRSFGESRVVCGVHNASAVEAGRLSGTLSATRMRTSPAFQADLAAAKKELATLTKRPAPDADRCRAEAEALAIPVL